MKPIGSTLTLTIDTQAAGRHTLLMPGSKGRPWQHAVVRDALRCGLRDSSASAPSARHRGYASALPYGCRRHSPVHPDRLHRPHPGNSCCILWHGRPERIRGAGERLSRRGGHSSGSCTVRTCRHRSLSDSPR